MMKKDRLTGKKCEKRGTGKFICFLAVMLLLGGCGQTDGGKTDGEKTDSGITAGTDINVQEQESEPEAASREELSVEEIYDLVTESVTLISPVIMKDNFIENYYNIDPALLEEYVFSMSEEATSAETVVIMKLKDKADAGTISDALQLVIEEKSGEMENYLPGQYDIVKKSAVKTEGSYVYLVISEQADAIEQIIKAQL
ncbi:DUF4358 domain-containing protein [Eisenbergiella sp.]